MACIALVMFTSGHFAFGIQGNGQYDNIDLGLESEDPYIIFHQFFGKTGHKIGSNGQELFMELNQAKKFRVIDNAFRDGLILDIEGVTVTAPLVIRDPINGAPWRLVNQSGTAVSFLDQTKGLVVQNEDATMILNQAESSTIVEFDKGAVNLKGANNIAPSLKLFSHNASDVYTMQHQLDGVLSIGDGEPGNAQFLMDDAYIELETGTVDAMLFDDGLTVSAENPAYRLSGNSAEWVMQVADDIGTFRINSSSQDDDEGFFFNDANQLRIDGEDASTLLAPNLLLMSGEDSSAGLSTFGNGAALGLQSFSGQFEEMISAENNAGIRFSMNNTAASANWNIMNDSGGRFVISLAGTSGPEFTLWQDGRLKMGPGGNSTFDLRANGDLFLNGTLFNSSDRNKKKAFKAVDTSDVLNKVAELPITTWQYKTTEADQRHMGPMAQDFRAAFGLGESDKTLATIDGIGVSLAAIKGLNNKVESLNKSNEDLSRQLQQKDDRINDLEDRLEQLMLRMESLESTSTK